MVVVSHIRDIVGYDARSRSTIHPGRPERNGGKGWGIPGCSLRFLFNSVLFSWALDLERSGDFVGRGYSLLKDSRAEPFYGLTRVR